MKQFFAFLFVVIAAMQVAATDRFYFEDFSIDPGETKWVNILLENETEYSAFQIDLSLPEGLTIVQEDGDYLIDLTDRKARDHTISSKLHADGSIRIMSYSMNVRSFSGNSGALVTMSITADESFSAPAIVVLRNILFSTPMGEEIAFADEACVVNYSSNSMIGDVDDDGLVSINDVTALIDYLLGSNNDINPSNADMDGDGQVTINDVTDLIDFLLQAS